MNIIGIDYSLCDNATAIVVLNSVARQIIDLRVATIPPAQMLPLLKSLQARYKPHTMWIDVPPVIKEFVDLWRLEGLPLIVHTTHKSDDKKRRAELLAWMISRGEIILTQDEYRLMSVKGHFCEALELAIWGMRNQSNGIAFV